jgi:hypothetical protein
MNDEKSSVVRGLVFIFCLLLASVGVLIWLAMAGNVWAVGLLFALGAVSFVLLGAGIVVFVNGQSAQREQQNFIANAKENLSVMAAMQNIQNKQNATIMQQLNSAARLPMLGSGQPTDVISFDESIFDELDAGYEQ